MFEWIERFLFAPDGGGWGYTYVQRPDLVSLLVVAVLVPTLVLLWRYTEPKVECRPAWVVAQWLAAGLITTFVIHAIAPFALVAKLESEGANGFYTIAGQYPAPDFLRSFPAIAGTLPMHVQANLPGKVLLYHLLRSISERVEVLAAILVIASTLGGLLVYFVTLQWLGDRRVAVVATIFYLVFPARVFFLPLLNTISPLLMLIALALTNAWAQRREMRYAIVLGPFLYALAIFDPLPLTAGLCGLAVLTVHARRQPGRFQVATFSIIVLAGLALTHVTMIVMFGFDLVDAYRFAIDNATTFNLEQRRPYWFWVGHNLKDFGIGIGIAQALAVVLGIQRWLRGTWAPIGVSIVACLLVLDLLGANRGEVQRLWIFLAVLFQIVAARACAHDSRMVAAAIALSIAQTVVCMRSIAWVVP